MPQMILYLDDEENKIIEKLSKKFKLSKADTVKRLIVDYR